ncbi:four helix bundle protein [Candidatus Uhrbacteria bacterium]|nr:four helix bundle protein [Candidatus Uhrbacteria bacterium]
MTPFQEQLKSKMHAYVRFVYRVTKNFPRDEIYGVTSQIRRAAVSIVLNFIEGYARRKLLVQLNFFETSYGSLQESKYLLLLSSEEAYMTQDEYKIGTKMAEEIGAMLWTEIISIDKSAK